MDYNTRFEGIRNKTNEIILEMVYFMVFKVKEQDNLNRENRLERHLLEILKMKLKVEGSIYQSIGMLSSLERNSKISSIGKDRSSIMNTE